MKSKAIFQIGLAACILFAFFFLPFKIYATRSITISADKSSLSGYEEMTIHIASMSGFTDGETIYIKGAFYKDGTSNYFGFTNNNGNWVKNGDSTTSQRQIVINNWDEDIVVKSDFDDSGYTGSGAYKVKIGFYYLTSGGNMSSVNWSTNNLDISISSPPPTPTNAPTVSPTSVPTHTPTPIPTSKPSPTSVTSKTSPSPSPSVSSATDNTSIQERPTQAVLGMTLDNASPSPAPTDKNTTSFLVLLGIGGACILLSCGILFFYKWRKGALPHVFHEAVNEEA
ncbi:MAG TPA: hypothetical protein VEW42_01290 [Candidatus Eisenbacteria bacterium]|nr:hypothetical protein [Candidatus Eisenbacteria bacterium]